MLAAGALAIAAALGFASLLFLLGFIALQLAYTLGLKRIVLVDVFVIAGLFVVRAAAGAAAVDVRISPWLLACTALLALFLGLAKRRGELVLVSADRTPGRPALGGYSLALVDRLLGVVAAATAAAYGVYAVTAHSAWMALTVPFVVAGPGVRADRVGEFGESTCAEGILGQLRGPDMMPVLLNAADRPLFLGSRPTPFDGADGYPAILDPL